MKEQTHTHIHARDRERERVNEMTMHNTSEQFCATGLTVTLYYARGVPGATGNMHHATTREGKQDGGIA